MHYIKFTTYFYQLTIVPYVSTYKRKHYRFYEILLNSTKADPGFGFRGRGRLSAEEVLL